MAKAKTKAAGINLPVPQSDGEAEQLIARLGALQCDYDAEQAKHKDQISLLGEQVSALNEAFGTKTKVFEEVKSVITEALNIWATANRDRLTNGGRTKTVQMPTGKVFWKEGSVSIAWGKLKNAEVVARIEARLIEIGHAIRQEKRRVTKDALRRDHGLIATFLQATVKPSKDAMGDHPELAVTIPGIVLVKPGESFNVEPLASQIREMA